MRQGLKREVNGARFTHLRAVLTKRGSVLLMLCVAASATLSASEPQLNDIVLAGERLDSMIAETLKHGTLPRRADPAVADVLGRMSDVQVLAQHPFGPADFETLVHVCHVPLSAMTRYASFGWESQSEAITDPAEMLATMQQVFLENSSRFRDELVLLAPVLVRCMTIQLSLLATRLDVLADEEWTDVRLNGLRQTKVGAEALYLGGLSTLADERLAAADRERLRKELVVAATPMSRTLPVAARLRVLASVIQVEKSADSDARRDLEIIRHTFSDARCDGLCAIGI
ncbi:hypothetical protein PQS31_14375 [Luteimonas sp BLCC-B24]|nr:hypothetical protein [Luteimonas sp. BLCC-B24]